MLTQRLFWPAWAGAITMAVAVVLGVRGLGTVLAFGLAAFAGGSALRQVILATRRQGWRGFVGRTNGGMIVHIGVVIVAVAIATNGHFIKEIEARFEPGETRVVGGHEITYLRTDVVEEKNRTATKVSVQIDGGAGVPPAPCRSTQGFGQLIGTPSVRTGLREDVYLTVTRLPDEGSTAVTLRVIIQPMALWLWIGGGVMAFGTVLAAWPGRRRRVPTDPVSAPVPVDDVPDRPSRWGPDGRARRRARGGGSAPATRAPRSWRRWRSPCWWRSWWWCSPPGIRAPSGRRRAR